MIPLGDTGFALCFWHELGRMDRDQALNLLRRSKSDIWAQASLRSLLADRSSPTALTRLTDEEILGMVADLIASGELALLRTNTPTRGRTVLSGTPKTVAAPPPAPRPAAASVPPPAPMDSSIFPANGDPAAQAAAMQQAAQQGAPFCPQ